VSIPPTDLDFGRKKLAYSPGILIDCDNIIQEFPLQTVVQVATCPALVTLLRHAAVRVGSTYSIGEFPLVSSSRKCL